MTAPPTLTIAQARARLGEEAVRAAARAQLWREGDLRYLLHEGREPIDPVVLRYVPGHLRGPGRRGQSHAFEAIQEARAMLAELFVVLTGRQYGKSLLFVVVCAMLCIESVLRRSEPVRIPYAAPSGKQVDEFVTPHFELLRKHAPAELRPEYSSKTSSWLWPNGARVVVAGCEDKAKAERLRGPRAHLAVLDEAGFIPILDYVVESVLGWQLATTGGLMLLSSSPPESPDHPFVVKFLARAEAAGRVFRATTPEAPHMTSKLIDVVIARCGGEDTVAWQREGLAQIIVDPAWTVLPELFAHEAAVTRAHTRPRWFLPTISGDLGYEDLTVILFGYYDFEHDTAVIERELVMRRTRSDVIDAEASRIAEELWPGMKVHRRRIDAPPIVRADMGRAHVKDAETEQPDAWSATRVDDLRAAANAARVQIVRDRVRIDPSCTTTLAHAKYARWNKQRTGLDRPSEAEHHYDGCAALLYFLRDLDRSTNPAPVLPPEVLAAAGNYHIGHELGARPDDQKILNIVRRR